MPTSSWLRSGNRPTEVEARQRARKRRRNKGKGERRNGRPRPSSVRFPRRPERFQNDAAHGRIWTSYCGRYRLRESHVAGVVIVFAQYLRDDDIWVVLREHRALEAARKTCDRHARGRVR